MLKTLLASVLIIAIAVVLLSVKVIFCKGGKFSSQHISDNPAMRKQRIRCAVEQDREAQESGKAC